MEKLNNDLFKNPKVENPKSNATIAGACFCQIPGNSYCRTVGGGWDLRDPGGG